MGLGAPPDLKGASWATWGKLESPGPSGSQPPSQPGAGGSEGKEAGPGASGEERGPPPGLPATALRASRTSESGAEATSQLPAENSQLLRRGHCLRLCVCVCMYVCTCICTCARMCVYVYTCMCVHEWYAHVCVYIYLRVCLCVYMCACVYTRVCVCVRCSSSGRCPLPQFLILLKPQSSSLNPQNIQLVASLQKPVPAPPKGQLYSFSLLQMIDLVLQIQEQ